MEVSKRLEWGFLINEEMNGISSDLVNVGRDVAEVVESALGLGEELQDLLEGLVELHGLLHGVEEVLLTLGVQAGDVAPGLAQVVDVPLQLRLLRIAHHLVKKHSGFISAQYEHSGYNTVISKFKEGTTSICQDSGSLVFSQNFQEIFPQLIPKI